MTFSEMSFRNLAHRYETAAHLPTEIYTVYQKNSQNCFCHNFIKFPPTLIIFGREMAKTIELYKVHPTFISPNLCQRIPCETQMLQIVTLHDDYLYQAHLCIINSTEGAT